MPLGSRILVVEDDSQNMYLASFLLKSGGHVVVGATDGEEAVAAAAAGQFDLVLLDMMLPRMTGDIAAPLIRGAQPDGCKIVALTAYSMTGDKEWLLSFCDGVITKPINPETFLETVEDYLS